MAQVYIKFPKTGLGNLMLVWARGVVFSKINELQYATSSWWGLRWGALLRREEKKRLYWNYFKETSFIRQYVLHFKFLFGNVVIEPAVKRLDKNLQSTDLFVFNKVITEDDLFGQLRAHQHLISNELNQILTDQIKKKLVSSVIPVIGIHVRRGDFKHGNPITPNEFFIEGINQIRVAAGADLPVTIFTDATANEIADILSLPNVRRATDNPDIVDILLLSKSKFMLLSQSSTFSYWGAFLSDAVVIRPEQDWQPIIKCDDPEGNYCEIKWDCKVTDSTNLLKEKLHTICNNFNIRN